MHMKELLAIGSGGFIGSVLRYLISGWVHRLYLVSFPIGTLGVNSMGSFLLGLIMGLSSRAIISSNVRLFLAIGVMGGFTTFSTFSYETMMLLFHKSYGEAFLNMGLSFFLGIVLAYLGYILGQTI